MRKIYISIFFSFFFFISMAQTPLDTAPDFSGKDINGVMHYLYPTLDSNNFVLLDFFTTTCGPCVTYAPEIQQAFVHFGSNQSNVRFFGINYADGNVGVSIFDSLYGIQFPTISGLNGHGNTIALDVFQVQSFPTMVFIAPNHQILNHQIFPPSFNKLDSTLTASIGTYTSVNEYNSLRAEFTIKGIFPNPVKDNVNIYVFTSKPIVTNYQVITVTGEIVIKKENIDLGEGNQNLSLNVSSLKCGIYFVRFYNDRETTGYSKFIIK